VSVEFETGVTFSPSAWQAAISQAGFDVVLDCDFDPLTFNGFLPVRYGDVDSGFEYFYDRDKSGKQTVTLVWHSDAREGVCGIIAAACLGSTTGGILVDCDRQNYTSEQALGYAREWEAVTKSPVPPRIVIRQPGSWWKIW
jgi:hypothetical protein